MSVIYRQIPNMPPAIALSGTEEFEIVQAGTSMRTSLAELTNFILDRPIAQFTAMPPLVFIGNTLILTTVPVSQGGTGMTSLGQYRVLYGMDGEPVGTVAPGTAGHVLTNVSGGPPQWLPPSVIPTTPETIDDWPFVSSNNTPPPKLTVGTMAPASPNIDDIWVDTN